MFKQRKLYLYIIIILFLCQGLSLFSESKGLFYEVRSETATVYVLGSFHALKPEHYPLAPFVEEKYKAADYLVVEANVSSEQSAEIIRLFTKYGMYSGDETLKSELPGRLYRKARKYLKKYNTDIKIYYKIKPWYLGMILSMLSIQKAGYSPDLGLEQYFLELEGEEKKDILELESIEFQVTLFDNLSDKDQFAYLESVLNESNQDIRLVDELAAAWSIGDSGKFESLFISSYKDMEDQPFFKAIFTDRNKTMTEKIKEYLETDKTYFVVVGAGHLIGNEGIINLLKAGNFSVEQL